MGYSPWCRKELDATVHVQAWAAYSCGARGFAAIHIKKKKILVSGSLSSFHTTRVLSCLRQPRPARVSYILRQVHEGPPNEGDHTFLNTSLTCLLLGLPYFPFSLEREVVFQRRTRPNTKGAGLASHF